MATYFYVTDEDFDCRSLSMKGSDKSTPSSQHSTLARPITLNFSDDELENEEEYNHNNDTSKDVEELQKTHEYDKFSSPPRISDSFNNSGYDLT